MTYLRILTSVCLVSIGFYPLTAKASPVTDALNKVGVAVVCSSSINDPVENNGSIFYRVIPESLEDRLNVKLAAIDTKIKISDSTFSMDRGLGGLCVTVSKAE